jgi:hypothetical protein
MPQPRQHAGIDLMRPGAMAAFGLAALAGGCAIALDDTTGGIYAAAPGKFATWNCTELSQHMRTTAAREAELKGLMARANQEASGPLINMLAYQEDLTITRSNLTALQRAMDDKRCAPVLEPQEAGPLGPVY